MTSTNGCGAGQLRVGYAIAIGILSAWSVTCGDGGGGSPDAMSPDAAVAVDAADAPPDADCTPVDDGNDCTSDVCVGGLPVSNPVADGTSCVGGTCNATGMCVMAVCGDGVVQPGETCDDGDLEDGDGCDRNCTITACGNGIVTGVEVCDDGGLEDGDGCDRNCTITACGNGVTASAEGCDDGNLLDDDGCTAACATEPGYTCTTAIPAACATTCGDGVTAGAEGCDDAPPAEGGDGCSATCAVEPGWICTGGAPSQCARTCGNGAVDAGEECDDGNTIDTDACSNLCQVVDGCGDGNLDAGELCDDNNTTPGDGCSAICQVDIACPAGQIVVTASNNTALTIPDNNATGVTSAIPVANTGAVTKLVVFVTDVTHTATGDVDLYLIGPSGTQRELSTDNGGTGDNYRATAFDGAAATAITSSAPPFTGRFRPEQTLASAAGVDFLRANGAGTWRLRVVDDAAGATGQLRGWILTACVDPTATYCGDGARNGAEECDDGNLVTTDACDNQCQRNAGCGDGDLDAGEQCDDDNLVSGDGCSGACLSDIGCGPGEQAVVVRNTTAATIPDNVTGLLRTITVSTPGLVRNVIPTITVEHPADAHLNVFLQSPRGIQRRLSDDQVGVNYTATIFSDAAAVPIAGSTADPFTGAFRPEQPIASAAGFANQQAAGDWILRIGDDTAGTTGRLVSWSVALCIDPTMGSTVCGNGVVETGETCDDADTTAGDGCDATCQVELGCAAGQTPVVRSATDLPRAILDDDPTGIQSAITIPPGGTVAKAVVVVGTLTHQRDDQLHLWLRSPIGTQLDLSSDNGGSGDDYLSTIFDDTASVPITTGAVPMRGRFRPEIALTGVNAQNAGGTWRLRIVDDGGGSSGVAVSWTLGLCVQ